MKKDVREIMLKLASMETLEDAGMITSMINHAFDREKFNINDYNALHDVLGRIMELLNL